MSGRVLIVEDDETIGAVMARALGAEGYETRWVRSGEAALTSLDGVVLVLLDLGLPGLDGVEVCRRIRRIDATLPVIMLTARQDEIDVVVGLDAGASDYVRKPFGLPELLARVRARLRGAPGVPVADLIIGDLRVDPAARRAWVGDVEIELRAKEFDVLHVLAREAGRVVTRDRLMSAVWDDDGIGSTKTLDVTMASLRRKLGEEPGGPSRIGTLRGVGYRFERP